ncbi:MAG: MogA/MoaB family molybdenum cofactor biosynthesis protein [Actinobacteria bacterium]|nr:MogA/MoaB family molybdenum cofactor biosynthesis protein [Actinomycetota bacterium]
MLTASILTVSDTRSAGTREDTTTALMVQLLEEIGIAIGATRLVPDEQDEIAAAIVELCEGADLVLTSGGTGLAPRDVTPEATRSVIDREAPGIAEAMRAETAQFQRLAWLSRAVAGTRGRTLVINLPGNPKAVRECLGVLRTHRAQHGRRAVQRQLHHSPSSGGSSCHVPPPAATKHRPRAPPWAQWAPCSPHCASI